MAEHLDTGKLGEDKATAFLEEKSYEILARNYRFRHSEIDIIAKKNKILIFAEVSSISLTWIGTAIFVLT